MYYVFSDESGTWNDSEFYIRAWIKVCEREYRKQEKVIKNCLNKIGIKRELKWSVFKKHFKEIGSVLKNFSFSIYITVSQPYVFMNRSFFNNKSLEEYTRG